MNIIIQVELISGMSRDDWNCELQVNDSLTLNQLHVEIQRAVNFDSDHLYTFYISRTERRSQRIFLDDEHHSLDTSLSEIFPLPEKRKLYYWFDFGADWIFRVSKKHKKPLVNNVSNVKSIVLSESGKKPEQYNNEEW